MAETYQPGEVVYVGNNRYRVIKQVLFNRPAYKLEYIPKRKRPKVLDGVQIESERVKEKPHVFTCDGIYVNRQSTKGMAEMLEGMAKR